MFNTEVHWRHKKIIQTSEKEASLCLKYGSTWIPYTDFVQVVLRGCDVSTKICMKVNRSIYICNTRRVPVQRAVERDEIPYPYKVHDTTLRPLLNITIKSTIVVRSCSRSCSGGDICGTTPAFRLDVNIATVAIQNSFWFNIVKKNPQKASGPNVADWQYLGIDKFTRWLEWNYDRAGRFSWNLEDGSAHLHTSPIVVKI